MESDQEVPPEQKKKRQSGRAKKQRTMEAPQGASSRWTNEEKVSLLNALQEHGTHDAQAISCAMGGTKAPSQIQQKIADIKTKSISPEEEPLQSLHHLGLWYDYLSSNLSKNAPGSSRQNVKTQYAFDALPVLLRKTIPAMEEFPDPSKVGIDFKEAYSALADLIEGKPVQVSLATQELLRTAVVALLNTTTAHPIVCDAVKDGVLKAFSEESVKEALSDTTKTDKTVHAVVSSDDTNPLHVPLPLLMANGSHDGDGGLSMRITMPNSIKDLFKKLHDAKI